MQANHLAELADINDRIRQCLEDRDQVVYARKFHAAK